MLAALLLAGTPPAMAGPLGEAAPEGWANYLVRPAAPSAMVVVDARAGLGAQAAGEAAELEQRAALEDALFRLREEGLAGAFTYDEDSGAYRAELSDAAVSALLADARVATVEQAPAAEAAEPEDVAPMAGAPVTSVIFAQVNSPLLWGNTNIAGLNVQLTLEDSAGTLIGVPSAASSSSATCTALPNCVNVDPTTLYFETVFVNPDDRTQYVSMRPGHKVRVITSGDNPGTPESPDPEEDKRVTIVSISACGSEELDRVEGTTLPNAQVIVTLGSLTLRTGYLTPGSGMTYAEVTSDAAGSFSATTFRTTTDPLYKVKDIVQGSKGFARVRVLGSSGQPTGDEVWTIWGQNAYVLQNSPVMHGYAYRLSAAPSGLQTGVTAPRPTATMTVQLKAPGGAIKAQYTGTVSTSLPYDVVFGATILGGDAVRIAIDYGGNNAFDQTVSVLPVTAVANLGTNQVTGTGPASTRMVIGAGNVQGYVTENSTYDAFEARVTSSGAGAYTSGEVLCGTSNVVMLQPGSFGYAGYEAPCGNFVYTAYAAPTNAVMSGFNYVDGWMATGVEQPTVAVSGPGGTVKQAAAPAVPRLFWLTSDKLYVNTYYNAATSVYIDPGDTVTIASGGRVHTIPVDALAARLYAEQDIVAGTAPAGAVLRVVLEKDRAAWKQVTATAGGVYAAANPYATRSSTTCAVTTKTENLNFGDYGRVYYRHPDGNDVFITFYNRMIRGFENANIVTVSGFVMRAMGWKDILPVTTRSVTVRFTPKPGQEGAGTGSINFPTTFEGKTSNILLKLDSDPTVNALIRPAGSLVANYLEGADGMTLPVTLTMNPVPLVIGSPDTDTYTVAAVGPVHWMGQDSAALAPYGRIDWAGKATLSSPTASTPYPYSSTVAYPPVQFIRSGAVVPLVPGSTGLISFVDPLGNEIYTSWGVTDFPYITRLNNLWKGDTLVCGTVKAPAGFPANVTVRIHDVTLGEDLLFATGTSDAQGNFCIAVDPPLYLGQVLLGEVNGMRGQPVVVGQVFRVYLPLVVR
jgi:hypothetical protein